MGENKDQNEMSAGAEKREGLESGPGNGLPTDLTGIFRRTSVESNAQSRQMDKRSQAAEEPGFTQMFQSLQDKNSVLSATQVEQRNTASEAQSLDRSGDEQQGEFTRMFQPLRPERRAQPVSASSPSSDAPPLTGTPASGGFTQLLRTLSSEDIAVPSPAELPPPVKSLPDEPGEFTRVVSRSAMREASLRAETQPAAEPPAQPERNATPPPYQASSMPVSPLNEAARSIASFPPPRLVPSMPSAPLQDPAENRLQQYVPLLLVSNLFLTAIALILLVVLLARP